MAEIHAEVQAMSLRLLAEAQGQLFWLDKTQKNLINSAEAWVLRAHEGTLEKIIHTFSSIDAQRGVELVALARNLFENLIWLKLFNVTPEYGLLFYRQLLESQIKSHDQAISQAKAEIDVFTEAGKRDVPDFAPIDHIFSKEGDLTPEEIVQVRSHFSESRRRVDDEVRRSFSVYAHHAQYNGYEYQAHLLQSEVIPQHEALRKVNQDHLDELLSVLGGKVSGKLRSESEARWNWRERAKQVGLERHYDFIYAYTSRLLHSTPMNIITPKELDDGEREVLLDYIRTGILDMHAEIGRFTFAGQIRMPLINVDQ